MAVKDEIVGAIYRAGAGQVPWQDPLDRIAARLDLWVVQFFGMDRSTAGILFSHEGGKPSPEVALDWFREYHRIDPRVGLVVRAREGEWFACDDHFDEAYVATSPFYQDFLLPYGGRYVYGAKIVEDERHSLVAAFLRGRGRAQLDAAEKEEVRGYAEHLRRAFRVQQEIAEASRGRSLGLAVVERMRQPILILDANRRIVFVNQGGRQLLARGDLLREVDSFAVCRDEESDLELMLALRELSLATSSPRARDVNRRGLRLRRSTAGRSVACSLLALRPQQVMGTFGHTNLALLAVYEPDTAAEADPFLLAATFDLTPAEARVASRVAAGGSPKRIAGELALHPETIRTHLKSLFAKTGTRRQPELVRALLLAQDL